MILTPYTSSLQINRSHNSKPNRGTTAYLCEFCQCGAPRDGENGAITVPLAAIGRVTGQGSGHLRITDPARFITHLVPTTVMTCWCFYNVVGLPRKEHMRSWSCLSNLLSCFYYILCLLLDCGSLPGYHAQDCTEKLIFFWNSWLFSFFSFFFFPWETNWHNWLVVNKKFKFTHRQKSRTRTILDCDRNSCFLMYTVVYFLLSNLEKKKLLFLYDVIACLTLPLDAFNIEAIDCHNHHDY